MAIYWKESSTLMSAGTVTHTGLVIDTFTDEAGIAKAKVWDANLGQPEDVTLGRSPNLESSDVRVDASMVVLGLYREWLLAEIRAKDEVLLPAKGKRVRVVTGIKVKPGTEGMAFWSGEGQYGVRLGIKTDNGETYWVAASKCEAVIPGIAPGASPPEGWQNFKKKLDAKAQVESAEWPKQGDWVQMPIDGPVPLSGIVFWTNGLGRIGFKKTRNSEANWADVADVVVMTGDPEAGGVPKFAKKGTSDLPYPFSAIARMEIERDDFIPGWEIWKCYDERGEFLIDLPSSSGQELQKMRPSITVRLAHQRVTG